jgi:hypothetical protein
MCVPQPELGNKEKIFLAKTPRAQRRRCRTAALGCPASTPALDITENRKRKT